MPIVMVHNQTLNGTSSIGGDVAINVKVKFTPEELVNNNVYTVWAFIFQNNDPSKVIMLRRSLTLFNLVALNNSSLLYVNSLSDLSPNNLIDHDIPLVCAFDAGHFQANVNLELIIGISPKDSEVYSPYPGPGILT